MIAGLRMSFLLIVFWSELLGLVRRAVSLRTVLYDLHVDGLPFLDFTFWRCAVPRDDDNRANQMNPNNDAYWQSRGHDERPDDWADQGDADDGEDDDNRANQMNPNHDAYWSARGLTRPE